MTTIIPTYQNRCAVHLVALLLASFMAMPAVSHAGLKEGMSAYDKADYATALRELAPLADKGHPKAQNLLGKMYNLGQGVQPSKKEAARWFHLAAEQGLPEAQSVLGYLCLVGEGVQQNNELALEWTRKAAAQGDANAQFNLSVMHGEIHGIRKDPAESLKWLRKSAEQSHREALNTLGQLYAQGRAGVNRHPAKAYLLISAAVSKGHARAADSLKALQGTMSEQDLSSGRELLQKWRSGSKLISLL